MDKWGEMLPHEIIGLSSQRHLKEFEPNKKNIILENEQTRIQDFGEECI